MRARLSIGAWGLAASVLAVPSLAPLHRAVLQALPDFAPAQQKLAKVQKSAD